MDGNYTRNSMFGIKFELKLENRLFVSEMRSVCLAAHPHPNYGKRPPTGFHTFDRALPRPCTCPGSVGKPWPGSSGFLPRQAAGCQRTLLRKATRENSTKSAIYSEK